MNLGKKQTIEFINQIELMAEDANAGKMLNSIIETCDEKIFIQNLVINARELIEYNEWLIALENTIDNMYEFDFTLDSKLVDLGIEALNIFSTNSVRVKSLEEMRKA